MSALFALARTGSACLLVQDKEIVGIENPPLLSIVQPKAFTRVPSIDDPTCPAPGMMRFDVSLYDADVGQELWYQLRVNNGRGERIAQPIPNDLGRPDRSFLQPICVEKADLQQPCNRVEMIVSSSSSKAQNSKKDEFDYDYASVTWFVLGAAEAGFGAASQWDCIRFLEQGAGG